MKKSVQQVWQGFQGKYRRNIRYNWQGVRQKIKKKGTAWFDKEPRGKYRRKILYDSRIPAANIEKGTQYGTIWKGIRWQWKKLPYDLKRISATDTEERYGKIRLWFPQQIKKKGTPRFVYDFVTNKEEKNGSIWNWFSHQIKRKTTVWIDNDFCGK